MLARLTETKKKTSSCNLQEIHQRHFRRPRNIDTKTANLTEYIQQQFRSPNKGLHSFVFRFHNSFYCFFLYDIVHLTVVANGTISYTQLHPITFYEPIDASKQLTPARCGYFAGFCIKRVNAFNSFRRTFYVRQSSFLQQVL